MTGNKPNALFNENKLKLGLFGINCDSGCAMTLAPERLHLTWDATKEIAIAADRAGYEVLVPVSRWKGIGGPTNFNGLNFETYTWAAGLASVTDHITLVTTSHVQVTHPIFAAKQAATIDHMSNGRYALNIVCGWFAPELEMFGAPFMEHDARYDYADEWFAVVKRLWKDEQEFDFNGKYFKIPGGFAMPKPLQSQVPVINAGGSKRGREYIARNADIGYVLLTDYSNMEKCAAQVNQYREMAKQAGREIQVWTHAYVMQRDTKEEAERYFRYITEEKANVQATNNAAHYLGLTTGIFTPEQWERYKPHLTAGYGGYPLIGTAESITQQLTVLSGLGIDGVSVHWVDYMDGLRRFNAEVLPRLEQAGLRRPYVHAANI